MTDIKKTVSDMLSVINDTLNKSPEENALDSLTDEIDDVKKDFIPLEEYEEEAEEQSNESPVILVLDYNQLGSILFNFESEGYEVEIHLPKEYPCLLIPSYFNYDGMNGVCATYVYPTHAQVLLNAEKIINKSK